MRASLSLVSAQVEVPQVFTTTLADLLSILEKATSGETGIHASGGSEQQQRCRQLARAQHQQQQQ